MRHYKLIIAGLLAGVALLPGSVEAAKRSHREKTRPHRTSSSKSSNGRRSDKKREDRHATDMREFERRWDAEQLEPDLPDAE